MKSIHDNWITLPQVWDKSLDEKKQNLRVELLV